MPAPPQVEKYRKYIWFISLIVAGISLLCPTYCTSVHCTGYTSGLTDLLLGWIGALLYGSIYKVWLANPLLIGAIISNKKLPLLSFVFSIGALLVGLQFLKGGKVLLNEAGQEAEITKPLIGYWLWIASMCLILIASSLPIIQWLKNKKSEMKS